MKKLFITLLILITGLIQAQTVSTAIGSGSIWTDSLLTGRTHRIVTLNLYYPHVSIVNINKSGSVTDSVKIESGTVRYKISGTPIDTAWATFALQNDAGTNSTSTPLTFAQVTKEYTVFSHTIQMLKFTLLNLNASAKYYFKVRATK